MSKDQEIREDPIKIHKEGTALSDMGKYDEAVEKFLKASELYKRDSNFFDASYTLFKAAECNFLLKNYKVAVERFLKSAEIALEKSFDRFAISALEYALDCYKALELKEEEIKIKNQIKELKKKSSAF